MRKILKILLIICILLSIDTYAYAMIYSYEAKEYIIKIKNINEKIEKIDLVNFEKCDLEETGCNYTTNFEVVSLFDKDDIKPLDNYDTENYYIKPIIRYNYLSGKAADDIEHTVVSGKYTEFEEEKLITFDLACTEKFNNVQELYTHCEGAEENEFICVKTTTYESYKLTPIKEISISDIKSNKLVYKHDDLSNLDIGIRVKNENGEYKTFISYENSMVMRRYGGKPIIEDKEKIIIFDYLTGTYKSNSTYSFYVPNHYQLINILGITIVLLVIVMALFILKIILKRKKANK